MSERAEEGFSMWARGRLRLEGVARDAGTSERKFLLEGNLGC